MKKKVIQICSLVGLLVALMISVPAQVTTLYRAHIPFDFNIGQKSFKSGDYTIESVNPFSSTEVLLLREAKGRGSYLMISVINEGSSQSRVGKLVFNRYGDQYVLVEINTPALKAEFPKSKSGNRLVKMQEPKRETIALLR